jgi:hypothetical protein
MGLGFDKVGNMPSGVILGTRKGGPGERRHRRLGVFHGIRGNRGKYLLWFAEEGEKPANWRRTDCKAYQKSIIGG